MLITWFLIPIIENMFEAFCSSIIRYQVTLLFLSHFETQFLSTIFEAIIQHQFLCLFLSLLLEDYMICIQTAIYWAPVLRRCPLSLFSNCPFWLEVITSPSAWIFFEEKSWGKGLAASHISLSFCFEEEVTLRRWSFSWLSSCYLDGG